MKEFKYIIPIGSNCRVASGIKNAGMRQHSLPFDWGIFAIDSVEKLFNKKFEGFLDPEKYSSYNFHGEVVLFHDDYGFCLPHEKSIQFNSSIRDKYHRRLSRMTDILEGKDKVLLVHLLMDCEPNEKGYTRCVDEAKSKNIFQNYDRSIDKVKQLDDSIKKSFPNLNYQLDIIHFDNRKPANTSNVNFSYFDKSSGNFGKQNLFDEAAVTKLVRGYKLSK